MSSKPGLMPAPRRISTSWSIVRADLVEANGRKAGHVANSPTTRGPTPKTTCCARADELESRGRRATTTRRSPPRGSTPAPTSSVDSSARSTMNVAWTLALKEAEVARSPLGAESARRSSSTEMRQKSRGLDERVQGLSRTPIAPNRNGRPSRDRPVLRRSSRPGTPTPGAREWEPRGADRATAPGARSRRRPPAAEHFRRRSPGCRR